MKIIRVLRQYGLSRRFVSVIEHIDRFALAFLHQASSRDGVAQLHRSTVFGARQINSAILAHKCIPAVERVRAELSAKNEVLGTGGPFDHGVTVSSAAGVSKPAWQCAILAALTREFSPSSALELGTNVGISGAYIASSMGGTLVTLEASAGRLDVAKLVHATLGLKNIRHILGYFDEVLDEVLKEVTPVGLSFLDGNHQEAPTLAYFEKILPHCTPGAVFIFDDIRWSDGMRRVWAMLKDDSRFGLVVDFYAFGVCVLRRESDERLVVGPIIVG